MECFADYTTWQFKMEKRVIIGVIISITLVTEKSLHGKIIFLSCRESYVLFVYNVMDSTNTILMQRSSMEKR